MAHRRRFPGFTEQLAATRGRRMPIIPYNRLGDLLTIDSDVPYTPDEVKLMQACHGLRDVADLDADRLAVEIDKPGPVYVQALRRDIQRRQRAFEETLSQMPASSEAITRATPKSLKLSYNEFGNLLAFDLGVSFTPAEEKFLHASDRLRDTPGLSTDDLAATLGESENYTAQLKSRVQKKVNAALYGPEKKEPPQRKITADIPPVPKTLKYSDFAQLHGKDLGIAYTEAEEQFIAACHRLKPTNGGALQMLSVELNNTPVNIAQIKFALQKKLFEAGYRPISEQSFTEKVRLQAATCVTRNK